jgi:hypothetical protein
VIENLLWKKGLLRSQIERTRRLVPEWSLTDLVEATSFDKVAEALANEVKKAPKEEE